MKHDLIFRHLVLLIGVVLISLTIRAQEKNNISRQGNVVSLKGADHYLRLEFCTPAMVRVRESKSTVFIPDEPWMVIKYDWAPVAYQVKSDAISYVITTDSLSISINKQSLLLSIYNERGELLSDEKGIRLNSEEDTVGVLKSMATDEHFFGFGERMDFLDQRSKMLHLSVGRGEAKDHLLGAYNVTEANYSPVPFFMSTKGYGIFLHNAFPSTWDMGNTNQHQYSFCAVGGELDYYFIKGKKFAAIMDGYTSLTGKAPLMPRFAFGLHMGTYAGGTWGYEEMTSDSYVIALARKMREMGIPVDILWLDSTWRLFGEKGGKGATSFEWRETFRNPKHMFDTLYAMNYKMVGLHLRPRFDNGKNIKLLDTAQQRGYTFPEDHYPGEFVNFFDTASANWWWNHGVMRVASIGAKFLKTDEGSAFGGLANESDKTGPQGKNIPSLHNLFPLAYAKTPYEKFQQLNGIRGMNQTREGFAGIQRYPFIFAGDWPSEWQYFAPVIKAGLNIGLSGVGNWSHCMGGFEHNADPELYMRWVQFGMFSPVALVFGMDHPGYKEPWNYGTAALNNFRKYDSLRYALIPYIYSNAFRMYQAGIPLMSALVMHYQEDENVYNITDEYLFGNDLLVCPVTTKGARSRTVYLPEGNWINYWTKERQPGHKYIEVACEADVLPLFVKEGSIIPMQPAMKYMDEFVAKTITLDIYPGSKCSTELYEDDGNSLDYKMGKYATTHITCNDGISNLRINMGKPAGSFIPPSHNYKLKILFDHCPVSVMENGTTLPSGSVTTAKAGWYYDKGAKELWIQTQLDNQDNIEVVINK
ncbi:MAG: glycoside hydrolase family 31 protein [Flavipsychrobacter sp.]|nr:glycoside hydrolase family 31 protein [Flavipsychrobacter sp.]